jgi:hypothetical protein
MWLIILVLLIIALATGTAGLLIHGLFWLFVLSACVMVVALVFAGVWSWLEHREERKEDAAMR